MIQKNSFLISLKNAGFFRSGKWLVRGVNLTVNSGEILTLIGPNGSGKSTTAKMAIGVSMPDEGTAQKRKGLKISYLPQRISIDWTLPIKVNRFMNLTGQVRRKEADEALSLTGAIHLAKSDVRTLSPFLRLRPFATIFIPSVAFLVKTISVGFSAPIKRRS